MVPVYREVSTRVLEPLSAYSKLEGMGPAYLLESVEQGEVLGRYSFIGSNPKLILESRGKRMKLTQGGRTRSWTTKTDPFQELKKLSDQYRALPVPGLPRFSGGFVGYAGYDMVRFLEPVGKRKPDHLNVPDSIWMLSDTVVIFDHLMGHIKVVVNAVIPKGSRTSLSKRARAAYDKATREVDGLVDQLRIPVRPAPFKRRRVSHAGGVRSNVSKGRFLSAVKKAKQAISMGEAIQIVLSQRFRVPVNCPPLNVYEALRSVNPSPYMFYLNFGKFALAGSSPEILVRCEKGQVRLRPIAGTRHRGKTGASDKRIAEGLKKDPKERAEHLMLVDLGRNDVGRVCEFGSVKVREWMTVERYSHVMHLVSDVVGKLKKGKQALDVLRASFPAGTVTGAPKVRAMQIINDLEPDARGPYAGAVGYIGFSGNLDTGIAIRTVLLKDGVAYVQAGAGIVADSVPSKEFQETKNKAAGMLAAIRNAQRQAL